jgi:pimeloyl-ACP methyl ester carboxylesterase/DNA-binding CsgD family transcriptional regulator
MEGHPNQAVRFCRAPDGTRIAYAVHGQGPPLLVSTCWLSHLQHDWESPVWQHFLRDLGRIATVIRYDERGHGLSDRDVTDFSLEARVGDLEAVADDAGLDKFALMAMAQGGPPSIHYAVRHPERLSRLVFYSSTACLVPDPTPGDRELEDVVQQMIRVGYGRDDSTFRRVFTSMMIPEGTEVQMRWLDDLIRHACTAELAFEFRRQAAYLDARPLLGEVTVPTLVLHCTQEKVLVFDQGRQLAAAIPGARFVALDSPNHIVLGDEPAWQVVVDEVERFIAPDRQGPVVPGADILSAREREVLELAADGLGNDEISARLHLSVRTVERHLQNSYNKLGVSGRSARAAAVSRMLSAR